jgi:hypothetical protein
MQLLYPKINLLLFMIIDLKVNMCQMYTLLNYIQDKHYNVINN